MLKRICAILVILSLVFVSGISYAQEAWPITAKTYTSSTANDLQDVTVYGISILATSASATGGIYDTTGLGTASNTTCRGEVGEATQYDSNIVVFPVPVRITNLTVVVSNGALTVHYRR